ncbi:MAG TPA: DSD1 family PLP-dependent enzyme [Candidatus Acidoferrales bacterium]|nr:DSD1 family PLP-dependent enzyme [Candidatus Acidoferrales bacterium]
MNEIGIGKDEIDTPALLVDLDLVDRNISTMANFLRDKKTKLRAHTKVHRIPTLALKQLGAGAKGICCQKVSEAEVMAAAGVKDIIVTNQIVTPHKIKRLVALTKTAYVSVPVDNENNARLISRTAVENEVKMNVLVDIHLGSQRCGVEPGEPALKLAQSIGTMKGLKFTGLMGFEGHLSWIEPREKRRKEIERTESLLLKTKTLLENSGFSVVEISTGSAGTYDVTASNPDITELQAGTYVLMDGEYFKHVPEFGCALTILSTVISRPSSDRAVTDAGLMSVSTALGNPTVAGRGDVEVHELHAENTVLKTHDSKISIGDKIDLIPSYLDATVNCHKQILGIRKGRVESVWKTSRDTST